MLTEDLVGVTGTLSVATRGREGPGEVLLLAHGTHETYLAHSREPLPRGARVRVVASRGARALDVTPEDGPAVTVPSDL